jgi:photosystem II stability/assembly factor-like uncharacterized protein
MKNRDRFAIFAIVIFITFFAKTSASQNLHRVCDAECAWVPVYPQHIEYASVLDSDGSTIIATRRNKFFITHDGGKLWEPYLEIDPNYLVRQVIAFDKCGESLLLNAVSPKKRGALYLTSNGGLSVKKVLDDVAIGESMFFSTDTSLIITATASPFAIWTSKDRGLTWECRTKERFDSTLVVCTLTGIMHNGHFRIIIGCNPPLLLVTDDTGVSFRKDSIGYYDGLGEVPQIVEGTDSSDIYACIAIVGIWSKGSIYHSSDAGETWEKIKSPTSLWSILPDKKRRGHLWVGQYNVFDPEYPLAGILETTDGGKDWQECGGLDGKFNWMLRFTPDRRAIILASEKGLYKSVLEDLSSKDPDNH